MKNLPLFRDTAKSFYAAAQFFEVLKQFGELDSEVSLIAASSSVFILIF